MGMKLLDYRGWDSNLLLNLVGILLFYSINGNITKSGRDLEFARFRRTVRNCALCCLFFIYSLLLIIIFIYEYNVQ